MKALIRPDVVDATIGAQYGSTWAEKISSYNRIDEKYRSGIEALAGKWVDIEPEHLFQDQFNTATLRIDWHQILLLDVTPEFRDKEELIGAVQKQYDEKWPGSKVNRYFIDYIAK